MVGCYFVLPSSKDLLILTLYNKNNWKQFCSMTRLLCRGPSSIFTSLVHSFPVVFIIYSMLDELPLFKSALSAPTEYSGPLTVPTSVLKERGFVSKLFCREQLH